MTVKMEYSKHQALWRRVPQYARELVDSPREFVRKAKWKLAGLHGGTSEHSVPSSVIGYLPTPAWQTVEITEGLPSLDVLVPGLSNVYRTGGPNTALNLAYHLASAGIPTRLVAADSLPPRDGEELLAHCARLSGIEERPKTICVAARRDPLDAPPIGRDDLLFATAWWTAQYAQSVVARTNRTEFLYLIQDYEPAFYDWSTEYALALETYSMKMRPIVCGSLLAEYLCENRVGRFAESGFVDSCLVFEPAIDRLRFYADVKRDPGARRRLLYYARPDARRNLFDMGLMALAQVVDQGVVTADEWELWFIGGKVPPHDLGRGIRIAQHPWLDYEQYAALLRSCDVGISLMLSPHTSYPPLEMAACGASVVTNTFANKTAERLRGLSQNLIPAEPTVDSIAKAIIEAVSRAPDLAARTHGAMLSTPATWTDAFKPVVPNLVGLWSDRAMLL